MGTVTVVGLGPAGPDYLTPRAAELLSSSRAVLRTRIHPAAAAFGDVASFDHLYDAAEDFATLYRTIVEDLVARAASGPVVYGVPGSPLVAEHTVELLRADPRVDVVIEPAMSFLDLAWARLGIDPVALGVTLADATDLLARRDVGGPVLIAQVWSEHLVAELVAELDSLSRSAPSEVTVLHHLGLDDEVVATVSLHELQRLLEPDHLTSLYVAEWPSAGAAFGRLMALAERLRRDCPWDQEQTHASLARHLLEEAYEALDALDALGTAEDPIQAATDVEEELGDVLFQVCFHAVLGTESGDFTASDIADSVRTKLISRHPHVFGDVEASTAAAVAENWEANKKKEKGRASVTEGIPLALPALASYAKLLSKASSVGFTPTVPDLRSALQLLEEESDGNAATEQVTQAVLIAAVQMARNAGIDAEAVLRSAAAQLRSAIVAFESAGAVPPFAEAED